MSRSIRCREVILIYLQEGFMVGSSLTGEALLCHRVFRFHFIGRLCLLREDLFFSGFIRCRAGCAFEGIDKAMSRYTVSGTRTSSVAV